MSRAIILVCTFCAVLSSSWLENTDAQLINGHDSSSIIQSIETLNTIVGNLEAEIKLQSSMLNNLASKQELESILLNHLLSTKLDMKMQETSFKTLEAKAAMHDNSLNNLQATVDELKTLLINSNVKEGEQVASLSNLDVQSNIQTILLNKVGVHIENQASLLDNFLTKEKIMQANNLTIMGAKVETTCNEEAASTDIPHSSVNKGFVEGIIAGTSKGVVIIPLDLQEQRTISSKDTLGVAFDWQSRKVYWIEYKVGIKIANLDGSSVELLVADTSHLRGLAVDQITGNFYYGVTGSSPEIRVCDSRGKKCATVTSGVDNVGANILDIALFSTEGLMFWSDFGDSRVRRANLDGTNNAIEIALEDAYGLFVDEFAERLYWTNYYGNTIGHRRLDGHNQNVLLSTTNSPFDHAVDGDILYFGGSTPNGIYSVTSNLKVSSIANTTADVYHITLYGRNKVPSRPNPCKNSPCSNLCVLTRIFYTCL